MNVLPVRGERTVSTSRTNCEYVGYVLKPINDYLCYDNVNEMLGTVSVVGLEHYVYTKQFLPTMHFKVGRKTSITETFGAS